MREGLRPETAVQCVIEILIDSQEGLAAVGERLQDQALTRYFFAESLLRAQFIDQLETVLRQRGVRRFRENGSAAAALQRTWARIKSRFMGGDHTLLVTAEQGEDAATRNGEIHPVQHLDPPVGSVHPDDVDLRPQR